MFYNQETCICAYRDIFRQLVLSDDSSCGCGSGCVLKSSHLIQSMPVSACRWPSRQLSPNVSCRLRLATHVHDFRLPLPGSHLTDLSRPSPLCWFFLLPRNQPTRLYCFLQTCLLLLPESHSWQHRQITLSQLAYTQVYSLTHGNL
jgi:hypothetical protein